MRRKFIIVLVAMLLAVLPWTPVPATHVEPVPDGVDCANLPAGTHSVMTSEQDRGAVCVSDGNSANGAEQYVGGDAQADEAYPDNPDHQPTEPCGATIAAGTVLSGTRPDDPATPEDERADWDWQHLHGFGPEGPDLPPPHLQLSRPPRRAGFPLSGEQARGHSRLGLALPTFLEALPGAVGRPLTETDLVNIRSEAGSQACKLRPG